MRTRAAVSQYVLVEIKRPDTPLLRNAEYRPGVWTASRELSDAVSQVQKTAFEFTNGRLRDDSKDAHGAYTGIVTFSIEPRTYLVVGNQAELVDQPDKITCFELFRKNIRSPEIITYDELFERAQCIVKPLDTQTSSSKDTDEIPF